MDAADTRMGKFSARAPARVEDYLAPYGVETALLGGYSRRRQAVAWARWS